jgi:hypothetical protein
MISYVKTPPVGGFGISRAKANAILLLKMLYQPAFLTLPKPYIMQVMPVENIALNPPPNMPLGGAVDPLC